MLLPLGARAAACNMARMSSRETGSGKKPRTLLRVRIACNVSFSNWVSRLFMGIRLVLGYLRQLKYAAIITEDGNFTLPFFQCMQDHRAVFSVAAICVRSSCSLATRYLKMTINSNANRVFSYRKKNVPYSKGSA